MMMIAAGGQERGLSPKALLQLEAEHAAIKGERAIEIGDLQMNMADANARIDQARRQVWLDRRQSGGLSTHGVTLANSTSAKIWTAAMRLEKKEGRQA